MNHSPIESGNPAAVLDRSDFKNALDKIKLVIERGNIPIIENVLLSAEAGALLLTATDLDMVLTVRVEGDVDGRISTTLPAQLLLTTASRSKSDNAVIEVLPGEPEIIALVEKDGTPILDEDGNQQRGPRQYNSFISQESVIGYGKTKYTLNSRPSDDFPEFPEFKKKTTTMLLPGSTLWDALDSVKGAISTEETRYYLNGIFFYLHDGETLRAVATDGHRLYCQDMAAPSGVAGMPGVIVPRKMVTVLHKLLGGKTCPRQVKITLDDALFQVSWGGITIRSKVIDGTFPDYARVVPAHNQHRAVIDAADLKVAVAEVTAIHSERGKAVKAVFDGEACTLSSRNAELGSSQTTIEVQFKSDPIEVGFDSTYLVDVIGKACPAGGDLIIDMETGQDPVLFTGEQSGWRAVLMPTRV